MSSKTFSLVAGWIFLLIAVLHLLRIIYGWPGVIGGLNVPLWASWVALILAGYLAYHGLKLSKS